MAARPDSVSGPSRSSLEVSKLERSVRTITEYLRDITEPQTRTNDRLAGLADGHEDNSFKAEMRACLVELSKEVSSYAEQSQSEAARAWEEGQEALRADKITSEHLAFYGEEEQIGGKDIARLTHALKVLLDDSRAFAYATEHYVTAPVESDSTE